MTAFIAAAGSGRSTSVIPAVPAASSVTTIAFIRYLPVEFSPGRRLGSIASMRRALGLSTPSVAPRCQHQSVEPTAPNPGGSYINRCRFTQVSTFRWKRLSPLGARERRVAMQKKADHRGELLGFVQDGTRSAAVARPAAVAAVDSAERRCRQSILLWK